MTKRKKFLTEMKCVMIFMNSSVVAYMQFLLLYFTCANCRNSRISKCCPLFYKVWISSRSTESENELFWSKIWEYSKEKALPSIFAVCELFTVFHF